MQSVTIYEKRDGDIEIQYGRNTAEVNEAIRALTTKVEWTTMNILQHWDLPTARSLARRILAENKEFLVDIWQNKQAERKSKDNDEMWEIESGQSFGIYNDVHYATKK